MKNTIFIIASIAFLQFFPSCKKDKVKYPDFPEGRWGTAEAKRNGEDWAGACYSRFDAENPGFFGVNFGVYNNNYYYLGSLSFSNIPPQVGSYVVTKRVLWEYEGARGYYSIFDIDVPLGDYNIINGAESNYIAIDSYDTVSREIKGRFEVTMLVNKRPSADAPDTVRFTQGTFHTRLD